MNGIVVGTEVVSKLIEYIKGQCNFDTNITVGLMSAKGKEEFYRKMGFRIRPNEREGNGMMMNI